MKAENLSFLLKTFIFLIYTTAVVAQDTTDSKPVINDASPAANSRIVVSSDEDYIVGPNDVLIIKIENAPELSGIYKINAKGNFTLPIAGNIEAKDKTVEEITDFITKRLKGGYLVNPIVSIRVNQSNKRAFFIQGAVRNPGTYQIEGRVSLLKLITIAGGLTDEHGSTAFVMRERKSEVQIENPALSSSKNNSANDYELVKININQLLSGDLENNIRIESGDIVNIPVSELFFVAGEVNKPGSFSFKEGTTLQQAISLAGGLSEKSGATAFLMREKEDKNSQKNIADKKSKPDYTNEDDFELIEIDLHKLMRGEIGKTITLKPRDFIHITEAGVFYVAGEVKEPGSFPIREKTTVQRAISLAKGTNYEGNLKKAIIYRQNGNGERREIQVDIAAIMKGEAQDVELLSNDILIVPNSKSKALAKSVLDILTKSTPGALLRGF